MTRDESVAMLGAGCWFNGRHRVDKDNAVRVIDALLAERDSMAKQLREELERVRRDCERVIRRSLSWPVVLSGWRCSHCV